MNTTTDIKLKKRDRTELNVWLRSTTLPHGQTTRARIILSLDDGLGPTEISRSLRVSCKTVHKWKNRFVKEGINGLFDQPRSGRPTVIDERTIKKVLKLTTERVPHEATHWSVQLMA